MPSRSSRRTKKRRRRRRVQSSDDYFFEKFTQSPPTDIESPVNDAQMTIVKLTINDNQQALDSLYAEALFTIINKIGTTGKIPELQLVKYVRNAFQVDEPNHQRLMTQARKEKPPVVLLNVHLLEARDLIAKDINGYSDPFAMMGVIPGKRRGDDSGVNSIDKTGTDDEAPVSPIAKSPGVNTDVSSEQHQPPPQPTKGPSSRRASVVIAQVVQKHAGGVLQRFGGSFRRKLGGSKKGQKTDMKAIPAKLIKASSVQCKTLFPKWNEKFQDHDAENENVLDAVTSLNAVNSLKGLGRYFKEVAQSARADSNDLLDDFLGSVNLRIKDIPSTGVEEWFTLEKRSERSEVSGQVLLKLWLSTKEERLGGEDGDDLLDVKQHIELIRQFALQEIRFSGAPVSFFQGDLPDAAKMILHQHAIQGDLTDLHQNMCQWLAFSAMINIGISYAFLCEILSKLIAKWQPLALDKEEENMIADSFQKFDDHCREQIMKHRSIVNVEKRIQLDSFGSLLKCLKLMRESSVYQKCMPAAKPFAQDVIDVLVQSADEYFDRRLEKSQNPVNPCDELYKLILSLNSACSKSSCFEPLFAETGIEYKTPMYLEFDRLLHDYIACEMMSEKTNSLKMAMLNAPDDEHSLQAMLKIHLELCEFQHFKNPKLKYKMDEFEWDPMFDRAIVKWFDLARVKGFARVDLACQLDAQVQISSTEARQTSSYIDVCHVINQLLNTWERMAIKDVYMRVDLTEKIVQTICKISEYYVDRLMAQLATDGFCGQLHPVLPPALVNIFCAAINNAEQVRRSLAIVDKLHLDELCEHYTKITKQKGEWRATIEQELENCERYIGEQIGSTIERMVQRQVPQMKKHVFHLAWSPGACPVDQSLKPLIDMLDAELSLVHKALLHKNFMRFMYCQLNVLIKLWQDCVNENTGLEPTFYQKLSEAWNVLVDFFFASGKGIKMETLSTIPAHQHLVAKLAFNQLPTIKLIERYYLDLLKTQNEYGILNLRAYYNVNSETLVVDVIGAKQIIALDTNGLSDPFVVIELLPKIRFPNQVITKTKVVSKSLNPIFDETFEFHVPPKLPPCALLHFVVMDHDLFRSNDFAGEAFLDLNEVPGFGTANVPNNLRQFNLVLIHSSTKDNQALAVLDSRKEDQKAQEFSRSIRVCY
ncbi:Protein unc-13-like protein D [Aphelenchoides bicaudatus]|nr:Protein unc-13-like protein D [Aphelenchoides bicaudatus]